MLLPYHRVEAIRMIFRYQFVSVWLGVSEYIKCQRTCEIFKNALTDYYWSRYWRLYFFILGAVYFFFFTSWSLTRANIIATINSVLLFILYWEFAYDLFLGTAVFFLSFNFFATENLRKPNSKNYMTLKLPLVESHKIRWKKIGNPEILCFFFEFQHRHNFIWDASTLIMTQGK